MRALLVALDLPTAAELSAALEAGWPAAGVHYADSVEKACATLEREPIDLVVLGASAADGGLQACEEVCRHTRAPVILVADRRGLVDPVRAAELGVHDFLWRPLTQREVVARLRGVLERARAPMPSAPHEASDPLEAGGLRIDYRACAVTVEGEPVDLTACEYALLYHLTRNANSVLANETLLAKVWGRRYVTETDVLRVHIERLRLKLRARLGTAHGGPRIARRDGLGYAFEHRARSEA